MDFSIFDKRKKNLPTTCEIIVVDFNLKKAVYRVTVDNLKPLPLEVQIKLKQAQEAVAQGIETKISQETTSEELLNIEKAQ